MSASGTAAAIWKVRGGLTPERRAALRRATDPFVGPIGSVRGARVDGAVGLTFDDGPSRWTGPILDVLARYGAHATFFVLVERAEAEPAIVRRIIAEGHEVGLHGLDHRRLTSLPATSVHRHVAEGKRRLERCTGRPVRTFRPPYGSQSPRTFAAARRCGLQVVVWTSDAEDWIDHQPAAVAARAMDGLGPGGILLLHDGFESDPASPLPEPTFDRADALDHVLTRLAEQDLHALDVERLLKLGRPHHTAWFRP